MQRISKHSFLQYKQINTMLQYMWSEVWSRSAAPLPQTFPFWYRSWKHLPEYDNILINII